MQPYDLDLFLNSSRWVAKFHPEKRLWGLYSEKRQEWKHIFFVSEERAESHLASWLLSHSLRGVNNVTKKRAKQKHAEQVAKEKKRKAEIEAHNTVVSVPDEVSDIVDK